MQLIIVVLLVILIVLIWGYEFIQLMLLSDADFPGRYDKLVWGLAFVFLFAITPFVFAYWRPAYLFLRQDELKQEHRRD